MRPIPHTENPLQRLFDSIFLEDHAFKVVRSHANRQVLRISPSDTNTEALFVKVYHHSARGERFKARLAMTGGLHDFRICDLLRKAKLPAPKPVACASWPPKHLLPQKTMFVQQWIRGSAPLIELIKRKKDAGQLSDQWLVGVFEKLGRFVATIHQCGFFPRDLHPANLLARETSPGRFQLWMIDYESVSRRHLRRRNIAYLNLGHLCSYLDGFCTDVHEQLSAAYTRQWPIVDPDRLAATVRRVAGEHFTDRQKWVDRTFCRIALNRKKTRHGP